MRPRDTTHPLFKELFIQTDADDLPAEDRRRRVRRSRQARTAMVVRPAARHGQRQPRPCPAARCRVVADLSTARDPILP
jgi:hypothetical protein